MSSESARDDELMVEVSKAELVASTAQTRRHIAADLEALKSQLTVDKLKDRALDAAERSVEDVALRLVRRVALIPQAVQAFSRQHPRAVAGAVVAVAALALWRARARARRARLLLG